MQGPVRSGLVVVLLLLLASAPVRGEEPSYEDLKRENEALTREVERLRARLAELSGKATDEALAETAFLVSTRDGVVRVLPDGTFKTVKAPNGRPLRGQLSRHGDDVFCRVWQTVHRINRTGMVLATKKLDEQVVGHGYVALPGRTFAVFDNEADRIFLVDAAGHVTKVLPMGVEPNQSMQNTFGLVVDGRLLLSEDGTKGILAIDLETHTVEVLRRFTTLRSWLGAIAHADGAHYVCTSQDVYAFAAEGPPRRVARVPKGNISGMVIVGGSAFVTVNFPGELLRIDLDSGDVTILASGLSFPESLVAVPR